MERSLEDTLWMLIMRSADLGRNYAFAVQEEDVIGKVTIAQQHVLSVVYANPETGLMLKDIAMQLNLTPGAVSQTVESLVRLGAVERVPAEHDRRAVIIRPSAKGMRMKALSAARIDPVMREVLDAVTEPERKIFLKILEMLVDKLALLNLAEKKTKSMRLHAAEAPK